MSTCCDGDYGGGWGERAPICVHIEETCKARYCIVYGSGVFFFWDRHRVRYSGAYKAGRVVGPELFVSLKKPRHLTTLGTITKLRPPSYHTTKLLKEQNLPGSPAHSTRGAAVTAHLATDTHVVCAPGGWKSKIASGCTAIVSAHVYHLSRFWCQRKVREDDPV